MRDCNNKSARLLRTANGPRKLAGMNESQLTLALC